MKYNSMNYLPHSTTEFGKKTFIVQEKNRANELKDRSKINKISGYVRADDVRNLLRISTGSRFILLRSFLWWWRILHDKMYGEVSNRPNLFFSRFLWYLDVFDRNYIVFTVRDLEDVIIKIDRISASLPLLISSSPWALSSLLQPLITL